MLFGADENVPLCTGVWNVGVSGTCQVSNTRAPLSQAFPRNAERSLQRTPANPSVRAVLKSLFGVNGTGRALDVGVPAPTNESLLYTSSIPSASTVFVLLNMYACIPTGKGPIQWSRSTTSGGGGGFPDCRRRSSRCLRCGRGNPISDTLLDQRRAPVLPKSQPLWADEQPRIR